MSITMLDAIIVVVIVISAFLAMIRGFSREILSLASWVLAALVSLFTYPHILPLVADHITNEMVALAVTLTGIFVLALLIISLLTMKVADLIIDSRIGALDRLLGAIFGLVRGALIVSVACLFVNELVQPENRPAWLEQAITKLWLDQAANRIEAALPSDLAQKLLLRLEKKRQSDTDDNLQDATGGEFPNDDN